MKDPMVVWVRMAGESDFNYAVAFTHFHKALLTDIDLGITIIRTLFRMADDPIAMRLTRELNVHHILSRYPRSARQAIQRH